MRASSLPGDGPDTKCLSERFVVEPGRTDVHCTGHRLLDKKK